MLPEKAHEPNRAELATMVMKLFDHWGLSTEDRLELLGLAVSNRAALSRYRKGEPLAQNRDLLDRVGNLLAIHQNLRRLFPHNRDLAYQWMSLKNKAFEGMSPTEVVKQAGFVGLVMVRGYLSRALGQ